MPSTFKPGFYCIDNDLLRTRGAAMGPHGIAVLNVLIMHANDDGKCWPSHQTIAEMIGMSRRQVAREINKLIDLGLVQRETRSNNGFKQSCIYTVPRYDTQSQRKSDLPEVDDMPHSHNGYDTQSQPIGLAVHHDVTHSPPRCDSQSHKQEPIEQYLMNKNQEQEPGNKGSSADAEAPPADEKTDWEIWLEALCWVCHGHQNTTALSEKDFNTLTAEAKRIKQNGHAQPALLKRWFVDRWQAENAWKSGNPRPGPYEVRCGLPAQAAAHAEAQEIMEANVQHRRKTKPAQTVPDYDDPWQAALVDFAQSRQMPDGILERARAEVVGEKGEAQVWQIALDPRDEPEFTWMQSRGAVLIRKTLTSIQGRAVLVDVVLPERETA